MTRLELNSAERAWLIKQCGGASIEDAPPMTAEGVLALLAKVETANSESEGGPDAGRQAIWKVVHEVWQLLDDAETGPDDVTVVEQDRLKSVSEAMDALEALVPDSEGPFWGGYPVNYFWGLR